MEKLRLHVLVFISLLAFKIRYSCSQLVVNVKTNSGKITKQQILADPEKDIVTIDFSFADGTRTTALIDFPKVYKCFIAIRNLQVPVAYLSSFYLKPKGSAALWTCKHFEF